MYPPENGGGPRASGRTLFIDDLDRGVAAEILGRLAASSTEMRVAQLRVLGGAMARVPTDAAAFAHRTRRIMVNLGAVHAAPDEAAVHEAWLDAFAESLRGDDDDAYVDFLGDDFWSVFESGGVMTKTTQPIGLDARAELRTWYLGRLRPRLESAVAAGTIEPVAVEALDDQLGELLDDPDGPRDEVA